MKATRQSGPPAFVPVVLTRETQDEVDALFGAMNFTPIAEGIQKAAQGNVDLAERFRDALQFFQTDVARGNRFHNAVRSRCSGFSHIP